MKDDDDKIYDVTYISVPDHDNCYNSYTRKHGEKPKPGSVETACPLLFETFGYQMIDGNIDEHPTSNSHRYGKHPIGGASLSCGVYGYSDRHTGGARHCEGQRIHSTCH